MKSNTRIQFLLKYYDKISRLQKIKKNHWSTSNNKNTNITNDEIDVNDMYEVIIIISKIYNIILVMNFNLQKQVEITAEICGYIVRFIISVSIQEHNVKNKELLASFEKIIDACVKLLQLKNPKAMRLLTNSDNNNEHHNYNSDDEYENENEAPVVVKEYGSCCF